MWAMKSWGLVEWWLCLPVSDLILEIIVGGKRLFDFHCSLLLLLVLRSRVSKREREVEKSLVMVALLELQCCVGKAHLWEGSEGVSQ